MTAAQERRIRGEVRCAALYIGGLVTVWGARSEAVTWESMWWYWVVGGVGVAMMLLGLFTRPGPPADDEAAVRGEVRAER